VKIELLNNVTLFQGDCRETLRSLPDNSVDAVPCDPPYELNFMGKGWDRSGIANDPEFWREVYRVLKPGGHLAAFSASRTYHRMACAIEDAGFEIRDSLMWIYGTRFPKSQNVGAAIDKKRDDSAAILRVTTFMADAADRLGVTRAAIDAHMGTSDMGGWWLSRLLHRCQCPKWEQWLQLKAFLILGDEMDAEVQRLNDRKGEWGEAAKQRGTIETTGGLHSGSGNTVGSFTGCQLAPGAVLPEAAEWEGWGTALKPAFEPIVLARKPLSEPTVAANVLKWRTGALNIDGCRVGTGGDKGIWPITKRRHDDVTFTLQPTETDTTKGRWPANVVTDGSDEVVGLFPSAGGQQGRAKIGGKKGGAIYGDFGENFSSNPEPRGDSGSAARFFYSAKASKADRAGSKHPTVKPIALMQWLARLITPPGGTVLDPFAGSGTTGAAAVAEGFSAILCEQESEYVADIKRRIGEPLTINEPAKESFPWE
jgi:DNA modification methylase